MIEPLSRTLQIKIEVIYESLQDLKRNIEWMGMMQMQKLLYVLMFFKMKWFGVYENVLCECYFKLQQTKNLLPSLKFLVFQITGYFTRKTSWPDSKKNSSRTFYTLSRRIEMFGLKGRHKQLD